MERQQSVHYRVRPINLAGHLFEVELTIARPDPEGQYLSLPAWIPGSYMIRDFAKNIVQLQASAAGVPMPTVKIDKQSWRCAPCGGPLTVTYTVYCWDLSVRGAHLDTTHGYFNGTSLFLRVHGLDHAPCSVELLAPEGLGHWRVATTLPSAGAPDRSFGLYSAADYDELVDHPVEMGTFELVEFEACGVPHAMAITGVQRADTERLARDLKAICEYQIRLFGEPAPMERYLFLTTVVGDGYGGLEHRSSTSLMCSRTDLPQRSREEVSNGYRSFLGLCSHEYFHTWNVKRIKPAAFQACDLSREVHTSLLWAFEGMTAYYDDLVLVRSGVIPESSYLELLGQSLTRLWRTPGRFKQSLADSSFDAWTKFYKQDENAPNAIVSYYIKGAAVALALDLTIRRESADARSLDHVMRALWEGPGKQAQGVTEEGIERLIEQVTGIPLGDFFDHALRSTEELQLAPLLEYVGIEFKLRPTESEDDRGGKPPGNSFDPQQAVTLGVRTADDPLGVKFAQVFEEGPAQRAGLSAGDIVVAVDGLRATRSNLGKLLSPYRPSDQVRIHAFRRDELLTCDLTLAAPPADTVYLLPVEGAEATTAHRRAWLGTEA